MIRYRTIYGSLLFLLGIIGLIFTFNTAISGSIGWDSPTDTKSFLEIISISSSSDLLAAYDSVFFTSEFYGIFVQQVASFINCGLNASCHLPDPLDATTYVWQGIVSVFLLGISAATIAISTTKITNSRLTGLTIWAIYLSLPVLSGLVSIDFKDSPLASGLLVYCSGIALLWHYKSAARFSLFFLPAIAITLGGFIALASRPASWIVLLAIGISSIIVFFIDWLVRKQISRTKVLFVFFVLIASSLVSLIPLFLTNPIARISLFRWLFDSYVVMSDYPMETGILVAGKVLISNNVPWWYVPIWILAQTPISTLIFWAFSFVSFLIILARKEFKFLSKYIVFVPFVILGVGLPIAAHVAGSTMYDGIRHSLFVYGPLAIFAGIGFSNMQHIFNGKPKLQVVLSFSILLVICFNLSEIARWSPYQYSYLNSIAVSLPENPSWETDYWGISQLEALNKFDDLGIHNVYLYGIHPATQPVYGTLSGTPSNGDGIYYMTRGGYVEEIPNSCSQVFVIQRDNQIMGKGYICD